MSAEPGTNTEMTATVGQVRVQAMSATLVRLEVKGPGGFEDRETFTVTGRTWTGTPLRKTESRAGTVLEADSYRGRVPSGAETLEGVTVERLDGEILYRHAGGAPYASNLPDPGERIAAWVMADTPRLVPPAWGATPAPRGTPGKTSGWEIESDLLDLYVFVPGDGGYEQLRRDFLRLTGPVPIPPLYAFGLMDSRYYPYAQEEALGVIDTYREKGIPLDVFVLDTDWRRGASHGYDVNVDLLPDLPGFLRDAHHRNVRVMLNDHPEPVSTQALDARELQYRYKGLTSLLKMGADVWWYDRNWHTHLGEPAPGVPKEVWGMRLYHDVTQRFHPDQRPLIMTNVHGINNGHLHHPPHPAAHRYPIWWTGDTRASWDYLERGIRNGVNSGVRSLLPYVHEDLGGHWDMPPPELYVRFLQYGVFSPITRLHCTHRLIRFPWAFGKEAETIATAYIRLRYRLLPTLYAAARRAYEDGTPILRRCDLQWPEHPEARAEDQYLLGDDLLVAPVHSPCSPLRLVPPSWLHTPDGKPGMKAEYFNGPDLDGPAVSETVDEQIAFVWGPNHPHPDISKGPFSARWTGRIGPMPETKDYWLGTRSNDGVRLRINGKLLIDEWDGRGTEYRARVRLEKGKSHDLCLEYRHRQGDASCELLWGNAQDTEVRRTVWIPPGEWEDLWTSERFTGPKHIEVTSPLWHVPLLARCGGMLFSIPQMQYAEERPWETVTVDAIVPNRDMETERILYEDDGKSPAYREGAFAKTGLHMARNADRVEIQVAPIQGSYDGVVPTRSWRVRLHGSPGWEPGTVAVNGDPVTIGEESDGALYAVLCNSTSGPFNLPFGWPGEEHKRPRALEVFVSDASTSARLTIEVDVSK